jgi:hypothetical protein
MILTNDPYVGGHASERRIRRRAGVSRAAADGFVASRAHWNDIGGAVPLSVQTNARVSTPGLTLPSSGCFAAAPQRDVFDLIQANVRSATQLGSQAQLAAARVGTRAPDRARRQAGRAAGRRDSPAQSAAEARTAAAFDRSLTGRESSAKIFSTTTASVDRGAHRGPGGSRPRLHLDFSDSAPANPSGYSMTRCSLVSAYAW